VKAPAEVAITECEYRDMNALLAEIGFHQPATFRLFRKRAGCSIRRKFYRMKPTAFRSNTSRGPVVEESALVAALDAKKIAGAALECLRKRAVHPSWTETPERRAGAGTWRRPRWKPRTKMAVMAATNVVGLFQGQMPPNMINPAVLRKS